MRPANAALRREAWLVCLARQGGPKGWQYFTVHAITHHSETASGYDGKVAAEMVSAKVEESNAWAWDPMTDHVAKTEARMLAAMENCPQAASSVPGGGHEVCPVADIKDAHRRPLKLTR